MDIKQALGIAFSLTAFHPGLVCQRRRSLAEKHAKRASGGIFHRLCQTNLVRSTVLALLGFSDAITIAASPELEPLLAKMSIAAKTAEQRCETD